MGRRREGGSNFCDDDELRSLPFIFLFPLFILDQSSRRETQSRSPPLNSYRGGKKAAEASECVSSYRSCIAFTVTYEIDPRAISSS